MPKQQSTAGKKARAAAREGAKFTTARRHHQTDPSTRSGTECAPAVSTVSYIPTGEADDEQVWVRPVEGCPRCPCHTARVCADALWVHASRPAFPDGRPYTRPCPVRKLSAPPLTLTFKGITQTLDAEFFRIPKGEKWSWGKNQAFLDEGIRNGDTFRLATPIEEMRDASIYTDEIDYLLTNGYTFNPVGDAMIPEG
ncbi:hypothetical protein ACIHIX_24285 [Streptomyces sp. NPDC051913]|uniref:hypothetical protein n=1 Tax=Streptomyces sp. NPDC051913 TaxID=3365676 RepID=UPI0037D55AC5